MRHRPVSLVGLSTLELISNFVRIKLKKVTKIKPFLSIDLKHLWMSESRSGE